jgi:hypothetical protein
LDKGLRPIEKILLFTPEESMAMAMMMVNTVIKVLR